jgi:hypothetical protein
MTLAPTNEAIGREIMQKKPDDKRNCHYDLGMSWLGVRLVLLSD